MASEFQETTSKRADEQKAALLKAIAEQGSAGRSAFTQAQGVVDPLRQEAMQRAASGIAEGQAYGPGYLETPGNQNGALSTIQAALAQSKAMQEADTARQAASGEDYFARLQGALPFVDQETQRAIQEIAAARAEAEADREFQKQMQQMQLEQSRNSLAASRSRGGAGGKGLSLSEIKFLQAQDLAERQSQFRNSLSKRVGPKTARAFNAVIGSAKDLNSALGDIAGASGADWAKYGINDKRTIANIEALVMAYYNGEDVPESFQHNAPSSSRPGSRPYEHGTGRV